jgi:hypothetical protein
MPSRLRFSPNVTVTEEAINQSYQTVLRESIRFERGCFIRSLWLAARGARDFIVDDADSHYQHG